MKPTLLVLAAGMGSRYGGLKQMDGLGPNGETIIDYSIYDAVQAGFGKGKGANAGAIQSYEFDFSITDKEIADSLMRCGGKTVELRYKEYLGALPWRGKQKYIVDGIVSVRE